jgi:hypothetical protein
MDQETSRSYFGPANNPQYLSGIIEADHTRCTVATKPEFPFLSNL